MFSRRTAVLALAALGVVSAGAFAVSSASRAAPDGVAPSRVVVAKGGGPIHGPDARDVLRAMEAADAGGIAPSRSAPPKWDTEEVPNWRVGVAMRPMDRDIVAALRSGHVDREVVTDVFADRPYRVRLVGSPSADRFALVLIDLNRDGHWDERWNLGDPGQIHRSVEHDPEAGDQKVDYTLVHGRWQPH